ncbi:murein biosynthesis integral membrane protein MurJ [Candidatus Anaplasma sp. TIGMIC]|uniref:murein biosynthesis integral membrane protein MurJ n=1 Tax=Candidatus Anaplasma sp. TIGMIC TaxID=3020713 RepID=UPI00232C0F57|nr:murein biosynthesis integral membrane protein MurJ [Candidatus Anaplasma sp. TIGMIC]MDB1135464.1 murein biosynthesis integral membrane protein MurJ [Candidatus Anaplasma sp. TIGMIC]
MLKKIFEFSCITFLSRILGLARDTLVAYHLGSQGLSDVFLAAFRLPNLFRAYFAEGPLSVSFVPLYSGKLSTPQAAQKFANQIFSILLVFLIVLCSLLMIFTPKVLSVFAPGFLGSTYKFGLAVNLTRIMLPYLLLISITSIIGSVLQTHNCFYVTAAAPIILNTCIVTSAFMPHLALPVYYFSVAVFIAGIVQCCFAVHMATYRKVKINVIRPSIDADIKMFAKRSCMSVFSGCMPQISVWINTVFASYIPGAITYFYYADRVNQMPQAFVGVSMSLVLMPTIAKLASSGDTKKMIEKQNCALDLGMTLIIPAAATLIAIPEPVLMTLLNYGQFDYWAIGNTASVMVVLAVALPAFVISKILCIFFYARGNFRMPAVFSIIALATNALFSYMLLDKYGQVGIAIGGTLGTWTNAILLAAYLRKRKLYESSETLLVKLAHVLFAATVMVAVLIMVNAILEPYYFLGPLIRIPALFCHLGIGVAAYLGTLCIAFRQKVSLGDM